MQLNTTTFTLAEYCQQMAEKIIIVNHDYQRSQKVWPTSARSYLIDTILSGYPIPKLILSQSTDLRTRKTTKEIVDGQQRSQAILDFFQDKLKLSGKSEYSGSTFSQLDEEIQQRFVSYQLGVDLLVGATPKEIREIFRRMNSYTIPLNQQERRHAIYQGSFKWLVVELAANFAEAFKSMGVFTERQITRMDDTELLTEIIFAMKNGIQSKSQTKLDGFYQQNETILQNEQWEQYLKEALNDSLRWSNLHNGPLMTSYNFYSLTLALIHIRHPLEKLVSIYDPSGLQIQQDATVLNNLLTLTTALESPDQYKNFYDFINACSKSTTKKIPRETRLKFFCDALTKNIN